MTDADEGRSAHRRAAPGPRPGGPGRVPRARSTTSGSAWVHFPVGFGGLGVDPALQRIVESRLRAEKIEYAETGWNGFGLYLAAPTIVAHAEPETPRAACCARCSPARRSGASCSASPAPGSDLASLATRAVRDGDEWVVNGQKVWNTLAHMADRGMLVARTDPDVPKHKGLTYFALDMHAPGVEVRPLVQITGEAEFNEVYMTDVRVPDADRIGDVGDGWRVSMTTLMNERVTIGGAVAQRESGPIGDLMRLWRGLPEERRRDPVSRDKVAALWTEAEVLRLTNLRATQNRKAGVAGPGGLGEQARVRRGQQADLRARGEPHGPRRHAHRHLRVRAPARPRSSPAAATPARCSSARAPTRSRAARPRSCATSWASGCSGSPASPAIDKALPWKRHGPRAADGAARPASDAAAARVRSEVAAGIEPAYGALQALA